VNLTINGERQETPVLETVADLAKWLELPTFGSAIELNGQVIQKSNHASTALRDGDRLEVVRLVGGG